MDHAQRTMGYPLMVLDMYEHAYMDWRGGIKYVDAFMRNVNWDEVNRRVETMRIPK
jgi:Fe-Mn family superoxide dismutase